VADRGARTLGLSVSTDLLIVARNQRSLFDYLKYDFESDPEVEVLLDRRQGERRQPRHTRTWNGDRRRQNDRRVQPPLDEKFESVGFAVVRLA
jgi:hypothetical protein